jgi:chromosome segregation ATPase
MMQAKSDVANAAAELGVERQRSQGAAAAHVEEIAYAHAESADKQAQLDDLQAHHAATQQQLDAAQASIVDLQRTLQQVSEAKVRARGFQSLATASKSLV